MRYSKILSEYYDLMCPDIEEKELTFWLGQTQRAKGTVLEICCGTGRILIPLLTRGIQIIGLDSSQDMLDRCREKCDRLNLKTQLFKQPMQNLNLDFNLNFVFVSDGSIGFVTTNDEMAQLFRNVYDHLLPGGDFMFDFGPPWENNLKEKYDVWVGDWKEAPGQTLYVKKQLTRYDPKTHLRESLIIMEKYVEGRQAGVEENLGKIRYYEIDEMFAMLKDAGFVDLQVNDWLSDNPVTKDSGWVTIRCKKPD